MTITVEKYTPYSIIVYGPETYHLKEKLKELGGKWTWLSKKTKKPHHPKGAWRFRLSEKPKVMELIRKETKETPPRKSPSPKRTPPRKSPSPKRSPPRKSPSPRRTPPRKSPSPKRTPPRNSPPKISESADVQKITNITKCLEITSLEHNEPISMVEEIALEGEPEIQQELAVVRSSFYHHLTEHLGQSSIPLLLKLKDPLGPWNTTPPISSIARVDIDLGDKNYPVKIARLSRKYGFNIVNYLTSDLYIYSVHESQWTGPFKGEETIIKFQKFVEKRGLDISKLQTLANKIYDIFYQRLVKEIVYRKAIGLRAHDWPEAMNANTVYNMTKSGLSDPFMIKYRIQDYTHNYEPILELCDEIFKENAQLAEMVTFYGKKLGFRAEITEFMDAESVRKGLREFCSVLKGTLWKHAYTLSMQGDEVIKVYLGDTFKKWQKHVNEVHKIEKRIERRLKKYGVIGSTVYENHLKSDEPIPSKLPKNPKSPNEQAFADRRDLKKAKEEVNNMFQLLKNKNKELKKATKIAKEYTEYPASIKAIKNKKYVDMILISSAVSLLVPSRLDLIFRETKLLERIIDEVPDILKFWSREQHEGAVRRGALFMKPTGFKFCLDEKVITFMSSLNSKRFQNIIKDAVLVYTGTREEYDQMLKKYGIKITKTDYRKVIDWLYSSGIISVQSVVAERTGVKRFKREIIFPKLKKKVVDVPHDLKFKSMPHAKSYDEGDWGINARGRPMVIIRMSGDLRWIPIPKKILGTMYADIGPGRLERDIVYTKPAEKKTDFKGHSRFPNTTYYKLGDWGIINDKKKIVAMLNGNKRWVDYPSEPNFWRVKE